MTSLPETTTPGYFEFSTLKPACNDQMATFTIEDWADMSELFREGDVRDVYPHFADELSGYAPGWKMPDGKRSPLRLVEDALGQDLHKNVQPLRLLSFQVGQITDATGATRAIQEWQRKVISNAFDRLDETELERPQSNWGVEEFTDYYKQIRSIEEVKLRSQVIELAGHIVAQNEVAQLYAVKEGFSANGGWLAPLVGLTIDNQTNEYRYQVRDVIPVIRQNNGKEAILFGASAAIHTAYTRRLPAKVMRLG